MLLLRVLYEIKKLSKMFKTLLLNLKNERKIYILGSASDYWKEDGSTWTDGPSIIN